MARKEITVRLDRDSRLAHNSNYTELYTETTSLKSEVKSLANSGVGGGGSYGVIKESQTGSGNLYKRFKSTMSGFVISNDSENSLTLTLSGNNITVRSGEVFSGYFDPFSVVDIKASGTYRFYGLKMATSSGGGGSAPDPVDPTPDPINATNVSFLNKLDTYEAKNTTGSNVSTFIAKTNIIIYEAHFFGPVEIAQVWSLNANLSLNKILFEGAVTGGVDVNGMSKIEINPPIAVKSGEGIGLNGYYGTQNLPIDLTTKESTINVSSNLLEANMGVTFTAQKLTADNTGRLTDQYAWVFRFGVKAIKG